MTVNVKKTEVTMRIPEITGAWAVSGQGGWYVDDKRAILAGALRDGYMYAGAPLTPGFAAVREVGEALLLTLETAGGARGEGDCMSVTYAGDAGRRGPFRAAAQQALLEQHVFPRLAGRSWESFRAAAAELKSLAFELDLHPALAYGLSQALLGLAADVAGCTITEVVCAEYGLPLPQQPVRLGIQTGDDRRLGADKAIARRAGALPHGLFKTPEDFGPGGSALVEYLGWLKQRITQLAGPEYRPVIHFDVYGGVGRLFDHQPERMAAFLRVLEKLARPYPLQIESPAEMPTQVAQVDLLARLCAILAQSGSGVQIIVDEWCNTLEDIRVFAAARACHMVQIKMPDMGSIADSIEAVLLCRELGVGAYLGGSCNETVRSAQVAVQVALATGADQFLARPGMGVDEALILAHNEMARTFARIGRAQPRV